MKITRERCSSSRHGAAVGHPSSSNFQQCTERSYHHRRRASCQERHACFEARASDNNGSPSSRRRRHRPLRRPPRRPRSSSPDGGGSTVTSRFYRRRRRGSYQEVRRAQQRFLRPFPPVLTGPIRQRASSSFPKPRGSSEAPNTTGAGCSPGIPTDASTNPRIPKMMKAVMRRQRGTRCAWTGRPCKRRPGPSFWRCRPGPWRPQ